MSNKNPRSGAGAEGDPHAAFDADVAIVGFGPVGAMLANLLGQAGVNTVILERDIKPHTLPRAGSTDDEVMRIFQAAGLIEQLLPALDLGQSAEFLSTQGRRLVTMCPMGRHNGFPQLAFFYQPDLEHVLHRGLERYPHVTIRMGTGVEAVHDDGDGVRVRARTGEQGRHAVPPDIDLRVRYVVGCDGGRSTVRNLCSIAFGGATYAQPWFVVDAKLQAPLAHVSAFQFIGDTGRPTVTVPLPGNHHRWEFMVLPGEDHDDFATYENARRLVAPWIDPDELTILRHIVYTFHARTAARWRLGRVLLAGDAAHLMPPFAGQGLASGMRDVHNLAWKLAAVIAGTAGDDLLDSYELERRPHVVRMTRLTQVSGALVQTRSLPVAKVRDIVLRLVSHFRYFTDGRFKPHLRYRAGAFECRHAGAGHAFPQPRVRTSSGRIVLLDEVMGQGWAVLGQYRDPQDELDDRWSALGASYIAVCRPGHRPSVLQPGTVTVEDLDGHALNFFDRHRVDIAVVRPDRIVFTTSNTSRRSVDKARARSLFASVQGVARVAP